MGKVAEDKCWYYNMKQGVNTLASFMPRLSKDLKLSQIYSNHSLRVTGATILAKNYNPHQIMAVTGHKSIQSLAVYERVSAEEKLQMGNSISASLATSSTTATDDIGTFSLDHFLDEEDDIATFVRELESQEMSVMTQTSSTAVQAQQLDTVTVTQSSSRRILSPRSTGMPMFNNCHINNIAIYNCPPK